MQSRKWSIWSISTIDQSEIEEQIEKFKVKKASIEANESVKENMTNEIHEKIKHRKKTIESNIHDFLEKDIQII